MRPNIGQIAGKKLSGAVAGAKSLTGGVPKFGLGAAFQKLSHIAKQAATEIYNGVQGITVGNDTAGLTTPTQTSGLAPTDQGELGLNDIAGINSSKPINQVFQKLLAFRKNFLMLGLDFSFSISLNFSNNSFCSRFKDIGTSVFN